MLDIHTISANRLSARELDAWDGIQQSEPELASPYFRPEFTQDVAAVRDDVEVAVLVDAGEPVGFFPFQRSRRRTGRPVGGPLSDFHGMITRGAVCWSLEALMRDCRLSAWKFHHLLVSQQPFMAHARAIEESPYIDLSAGFDAYVEAARRSGRKTVPQTQRKLRKFEREVGPVRLEFEVADETVLQTLLAWKSAQYRRTGLTDVFAFRWTVELLTRIGRRQSPAFRGLLSALYVGDRPSAIHFGMQSGGVLHYWFPAYDPEFARYSPGAILMMEIARSAAEQRITRIDLGKGTERCKTSFMTGGVPVAEGLVDRRPAVRWISDRWARARRRLRTSSLRRPLEAPLRLIRPLREYFLFR